MMKPPRHSILILGVAVLLSAPLVSCNSVDDERDEALERRLDRQNDRFEDRSERRRRRAEAEDERYHDWYDRVMNRPGSSY